MKLIQVCTLVSKRPFINHRIPYKCAYAGFNKSEYFLAHAKFDPVKSLWHPHLAIYRASEHNTDKWVNNELQRQYERLGQCTYWGVCPRLMKFPSARFHYYTTWLIQMAAWRHPWSQLILSHCYQPPWCISWWRTQQKAADSHWSDVFDLKMQLEAGHSSMGGYHKLSLLDIQTSKSKYTRRWLFSNYCRENSRNFMSARDRLQWGVSHYISSKSGLLWNLGVFLLPWFGDERTMWWKWEMIVGLVYAEFNSWPKYSIAPLPIIPNFIFNLGDDDGFQMSCHFSSCSLW